MQLSSVLLAAAALAVANAAQFTMTPQQFVSVKAGTAFNITWTGASGPVTLLLKNGASNNLQTVSTIASGQTGTTYSWIPDTSLPSGSYALEIDDSTGPNYSVQFTLAGNPSATLSSSASSTTGSSTTGSSTTGSSSSVSSSTGSSSSRSGSTTSSASSSSASSSSATAANSTTTSTGSNSSSSASKTSSSASKTSSTSTSTSSPTSVNSASGFASPLAFVLLALAAIMTLN